MSVKAGGDSKTRWFKILSGSEHFCQPYPRLRGCKSVFLILKILQYGRLKRWVQLFPRYPCKNWYKNCYLRFYKTCEQQIWQAGTSTELDLNKTNKAGADDFITARSRDKTKTIYHHYQSAYGHKTCQNSSLLWWARPIKAYYEKRQLINSHNSLNKRPREVTWNNKLKTLYIKNILSPLPQYLWLSNVARWLHITLSLGRVSNFDSLITFLSLGLKHYSIHRLLVVFYFFFWMYFDLWLLMQGIYLHNFGWFQCNSFSLLW